MFCFSHLNLKVQVKIYFSNDNEFEKAFQFSPNQIYINVLLESKSHNNKNSSMITHTKFTKKVHIYSVFTILHVESI